MKKIEKMWRKRWSRVIGKIRVIPRCEDEQSLLEELGTNIKVRVLAFVNAHAMNLLVEDEALYNAFLSADTLLRDGTGLSFLFKRLGRDPGLNMNGTDFIPKLLSLYRGRRVAFWGTDEPFLGRAALFCQDAFGIHLVSCHHGFENDDFYRQLTQQCQPELIVLGMGMPKQERIARMIQETTEIACLVVCGGAIMDFLGGRVSRAPIWMQRAGIEWLYRLLQEPTRLFKRYIVGNAVFMTRLIQYEIDN